LSQRQRHGLAKSFACACDQRDFAREFFRVQKRVSSGKKGPPHNRISSFPFCIAQQVRQGTRSTQVQSFGISVQRQGRFLAQPARQRRFILSQARPLCPPTNTATPQEEKPTGWEMD
jgi:hypothetical protein